MHRRQIIWSLLLLVAGLGFPIAPALADGGPPDDGGITVFGKDYVLEEGEQLEGNLVVFDGDVTLAEGSTVTGDVVVWDGNAEVNGSVEGDLVVSNGDVHLGSAAQVEGDLACTWNCDLEQEDGARVDGSIIEGVPWGNPTLWQWGRLQIPMPHAFTNQSSWPWQVMDWIFEAVRGLAAVLVVSAIGGLVSLLWPQQVGRIGATVIQTPASSFGIGLLTALAGGALTIALLITICFSPLALLAALALGVAGLFGWIGVGALVGRRLLQTLDARGVAPLWSGGLGTLLITLVSGGLGLIPCLGILGLPLTVGLGCLGLGAVVLTRFGTTAYTTTRPASPAPIELEK